MERLITYLVNNKMVLKNELPVVTLVDEFVKRGAKIELIRISFLEIHTLFCILLACFVHLLISLTNIISILLT